jgi:hypothetical protein
MNRNNISAVMIVLALLVGALMLYASADLMGTMNPDPHHHRDVYMVGGTVGGEEMSGDATCTPVRENGSFYDYDFRISVGGTDGTHDFSFLLIFDSDEEPFDCKLVSDGETRVFQTSQNGYDITFEVSDNCLVHSFKLTTDSVSIEGQLVQEAAA